MHWSGEEEIPISGLASPENIVDALYDSFVVNTTTFRSVMKGWASVNLGDLEEDEDHNTSTFRDVNDPTTIRVEAVNTASKRTVVLHN